MTGDFWFFAGIALIILATGYGCSPAIHSEQQARARLIDACADRVRQGFDVPVVCRVTNEESQ